MVIATLGGVGLGPPEKCLGVGVASWTGGGNQKYCQSGTNL